MISSRARSIAPALLVLLFLLTTLAGCGGEGGAPPPATYSISGTVSGYSGSGLVLSNNATNFFNVNAGDSTFSISGIANGSTYSISVATPPSNPAQSCTVINGSGTVNGADVTNVQVNCVTDTYTLSGSVTGLNGNGLVLQNNGADDLPVNSTNFTFGTPVANGSPYAITILAQPTGQTCTLTNDTGTVGNANITDILVSCTNIIIPPSSFTIGGTISGLSGTGLVLQNNGGDNLALSPNAAISTFTFNTAIAAGDSYNVTVYAQPRGQTCSVINAGPEVPTADVTNVQVTCTDIPTYTIGGSVSGLTGSGLVLQNNGGDNRTISADGPFFFATALTDSSVYNVTVFAQPSGQTCSIIAGSGTVAGANISNVQVNCVANTYSISGTVSGLTGTGLVLQNNGGDNRSISANGAFTFSAVVASGNPYSVTVFAQPSGQTCSVSNGSGTVTNAAITDVSVSCVSNPTYTIGGTVSGLTGSGLVLQNNGADDLPVSSGNFTFNSSIASGNPYNVTILAQPSGQTCSVSNGSGTVAGTNISNVQVDCITPAYTIGGTVSGLTGTGLVLQNNGGDNRSISANGAFTFNTAIANGNAYSVTVLTQPGGQTCSVTNGSGTVSGDVTDVQISCADIPTYTIGGSVSGLTGSGLVLQNNGGDNRTISADGAFVFANAIVDGNPYNVTIFSQPSNQTCSVSNGSGTVASANVSSVLVSCVTNTYPVSGSVSGLILTGTGLVLQNNGGDNRPVSANGTFTFNTAVASGSPYSVTILTQPIGQTCSVTGGSGTVTNAAIASVLVTCVVNSYSISGNVTGPLSGVALPGTLVLQNNAGDDLSINGYGVFTFPVSVASGSLYNVTISQQPSSSWSCVVSHGAGTVAGTNITDVQVSCVDNRTVTTGSMGSKRRSHSANRLADGRVMVTGGWDTNSAVPFMTATIFDPTANSDVGAFAATGDMGTARTSHTATSLTDGRVLVVGGWDDTATNLSSAEVFDPLLLAGTGGFSAAAGSMNTVRTDHSAVLLTDGTVLITGGYGGTGFPIATAEIFDPVSGTFSATTDSMAALGRIYHTSTRLNDGTVLIAGGKDQNGDLQTAEIYNPLTKTFSATAGDMLTPRSKHTATLLPDGKVLIVGGAQGSDNPLASAEIYDPATGKFHATGDMANPRADHTATLLADGKKVLITGGRQTLDQSTALATTEIYDPASGLFTYTGSMDSARTDHTATLLTNGKVLITGGFDGTTTVTSAELFIP